MQVEEPTVKLTLHQETLLNLNTPHATVNITPNTGCIAPLSECVCPHTVRPCITG